jgi:hypothetical protein
MVRRSRPLILYISLTLVPSPAAALCSYNGVDNAKTTVAQEFRDSKWVVRARVLSAVDGLMGRGSDKGMSYTVYRLRVVRAYKGKPPTQLKFFTERDSGAFYMDRAWVPLPRGHDVGTDYLLFLNPIEPFRGEPSVEKGSVFVNYSCGQSKRWSEVPQASRRRLQSLSHTN